MEKIQEENIGKKSNLNKISIFLLKEIIGFIPLEYQFKSVLRVNKFCLKALTDSKFSNILPCINKIKEKLIQLIKLELDKTNIGKIKNEISYLEMPEGQRNDCFALIFTIKSEHENKRIIEVEKEFMYYFDFVEKILRNKIFEELWVSWNSDDDLIKTECALFLRKIFKHRKNILLKIKINLNKACTNLNCLEIPNLSFLDLSNNFIRNKDVNHLIGAYLPDLKVLNLSDNEISNGGIETLKDANFPQLVELNLSYNNIEENGIKALQLAKFPNLRILKLRKNQFESKAVQSIADLRFLLLENLDISKNNIGNEGVKFLAEINFNLKVLNLSDNQIKDEGVKHLLKVKFNQLETLDLSYNKITSDGVRYFKEIKFENLSNLNLRNNLINKKGIQYLNETLLKELKSLNMSYNNLIDDDFYLINRDKFPKLEDLIFI